MKPLTGRRSPGGPSLPVPVEGRPARGPDAVEVVAGGRRLGRVDGAAWRTLGLTGVLTADDWPALEAALRAREAYEYGLRLLAAADRSRAELVARLRARCGEAAAAAAAARLAPYLDDLRFARSWVERRQASRPLGRAALLAGLARRGVPRGVARRAVDELAAMPPAAAGSAGHGEGEEEACLRAARDAARRLAGTPPARLRARLYAQLTRRGFGAETAWEAVRRVAGEGDDPEA